MNFSAHSDVTVSLPGMPHPPNRSDITASHHLSHAPAFRHEHDTLSRDIKHPDMTCIPPFYIGIRLSSSSDQFPSPTQHAVDKSYTPFKFLLRKCVPYLSELSHLKLEDLGGDGRAERLIECACFNPRSLVRPGACNLCSFMSHHGISSSLRERWLSKHLESGEPLPYVTKTPGG